MMGRIETTSTLKGRTRGLQETAWLWGPFPVKERVMSWFGFTLEAL